MVHGIGTADGSSAWTFNAGAKVDSSPVISGDRVFLGVQSGQILALDLAELQLHQHVDRVEEEQPDDHQSRGETDADDRGGGA